MGIAAAFFGFDSIVRLLNWLKIPKLEFDEFFKNDASIATNTGVYNRITYFVKIMNTNRKSEGRAGSCTGFVSVSGKSYKTIWKEMAVANTVLLMTIKKIRSTLFR